MRYVVWGWTAVFDPEGRVVDDRTILKELSGFIDDEDLFATDFIGGTDEEDSLSLALEQSGRLRFELRDGEKALRVFHEYVAKRALSPTELQCLGRYTLGQWTDGMGESVFVPRGKYKDYKLQPVDEYEVSARPYPFTEIIERIGSV